MKYSEVKDKSLQDLENMIKDLRLQLGKARFELANNTLKNTSLIGKIKNEIAKSLTAIREKRKTDVSRNVSVGLNN